MADSGLKLFCVECRPVGDDQAHTFFVPAFDAKGAILRALETAREVRLANQEPLDPFDAEDRLEVRVGRFPPGDGDVEFGEWSPLAH